MAFLELQFFSQMLHTNAQLQVILPQPGSQSGWDGKTPLPVLYLLHGRGGDHSDWQRMTSVERYGEKKPLAMVMMSNLLGEYTNQRYGYPYFDYVSQEVWEISHSYFPLSEKREDNFIAGLSMGGYGALKIGLRMPERFSYAAGLSAACDRYKPLPEEARSIQSIEEFRAKRQMFDRDVYEKAMHFYLNYGSPQEFLNSREDNLFLIAEDAAKSGKVLPKLMMICGTEDEWVLPSNRRFHEHLLSLGISHTYYESPGAHTWDYWDTEIQRVLEWLPV